jgi:hypothetical protein
MSSVLYALCSLTTLRICSAGRQLRVASRDRSLISSAAACLCSGGFAKQFACFHSDFRATARAGRGHEHTLRTPEETFEHAELEKNALDPTRQFVF